MTSTCPPLPQHLRLPLRTKRLVLRTYEPHDAQALQRYYSKPHVAQYLLDEPWDATVAEQKIPERMKRSDLDGEAGALALVVELSPNAVGAPQTAPAEPASPQVIGDVGLWYTDREHRIAEIGWAFDSEFGGHGYATEAARTLLDLAFDHYGVHRVEAQLDSRNTTSAKLATRLGMQQEAHKRQDWWNKGQYTDTLIFGLLASDR